MLDSKRRNSIYSPKSSTPLRSAHLVTRLSRIDGFSIKASNNCHDRDSSDTSSKNVNEGMLKSYFDDGLCVNFTERAEFNGRDIDFMMKRSVSEKLLFSNEYLISSRLVALVRHDLLQIKDYLTLKVTQSLILLPFSNASIVSQNSVRLNSDLKTVMTALKANTIPESWWKAGFFTEDNQNITLVTFIKMLLCKLEHIHLIFKNNKSKLTPILCLSKLFDPFGFITSLMLTYAVRFQVNKLHILQPNLH